MKHILKILILIVLLFNSSYGATYENVNTISLKKDEQKKIFVKYANVKRLFTFRWTLYVNDGLVVFHSYDNIKGQNILYINNQNRSFIVQLKSRGADAYDVPRLLVKFEKFDVKKNRAIFELFLADGEGQIGLEYIKND